MCRTFAVLVALTACGAPPTPTVTPSVPDAPPTPTSFIALLADFADYQQWPQVDLGNHPADGLHLAGHRQVFINRLPPRGATSFALGTVLIKTVIDETDGGSQVFAMAKRGGSFNQDGAAGWEWFQLDAPGRAPNIEWRGEMPPLSALYGGQHVSCNTCHALATGNDSVLTAQFALLPL